MTALELALRSAFFHARNLCARRPFRDGIVSLTRSAPLPHAVATRHGDRRFESLEALI